MRVVHITSAHSRGDVRIFLKECASLARYGHEVTLLVADGLGDQPCQGTDMVSIVDAGRFDGRVRRMLKAPKRLLKLAKSIHADVYHLHDPELLIIALALRKGGCKVIFDAHEDVPKQILTKHYLPPWTRHAISRVVSVYERYVCSRLSGVVGATPTIRDKFMVCAQRAVDVNNFPLLGELDSVGDSLRTGMDICYVGGMAAIRGIQEIVRAMGYVTQRDVCLNLVGSFIEPEVEARLRASPEWSSVKAWGQQNRTGVRQVLARSSIGLVTLHPTVNYVDALPIKMFEYMAAGIPVIASDFPLWRSIIESAGCGVCVDPLDPRAIARAIDDLLADPDRAVKMGMNGRQAVLERFNWGIEEKKLLDFYQGLSKTERASS
ncbi:glycosyltransferase family 4 protein [Castellaniella sp.]|uniref:glycosyltransferase family 4 protein n=1 Tax=Castellaniella sp. TaxID=1955812 RepID=UPI002AFEED99|nr:glycosyltransferase family 4 protein [Castellaniella sp.]